MKTLLFMRFSLAISPVMLTKYNSSTQDVTVCSKVLAFWNVSVYTASGNTLQERGSGHARLVCLCDII